MERHFDAEGANSALLGPGRREKPSGNEEASPCTADELRCALQAEAKRLTRSSSRRRGQSAQHRSAFDGQLSTSASVERLDANVPQSVETLRSEAAAFSRAHRALRGASVPKRSRPASAAFSSLRDGTTSVGAGGGRPCPACGHLCSGEPTSPASAHSYRAEADDLAARLEVVEELLRRSELEAKEALGARRALAVERARNADLREALAATKRVADSLQFGYTRVVKEFSTFIMDVRRTAAPVAPGSSTTRAMDSLLHGARAAALDTTRIRDMEESFEEERRRLHLEIEECETYCAEFEQEDSDHRRSMEQNSRIMVELERQLREEQAIGLRTRRASEATLAELLCSEETREGTLCELQSLEGRSCRSQTEVLSVEMELARSELEVQDAARELQDAAREIEQESATAHRWHREADENCEVSQRHRCQTEAYEDELSHAYSEATALREAEELRDEKRLEELKARHAAVQKGRIRAVRSALGGAIMQKLSQRRQIWQPRFVMLVSHLGADELRWSSDVKGRTLGRNPTALQLTQIVRIDFGDRLLPPVRPKERPWCCFTLVGQKRTYSFHTEDDRTLESFVVGLSRLCSHIPAVLPSDIRLYQAHRKLGGGGKAICSSMLQSIRRHPPPPRTPTATTSPVVAADAQGRNNDAEPTAMAAQEASQPAQDVAVEDHASQQQPDLTDGDQCVEDTAPSRSADAASAEVFEHEQGHESGRRPEND